MGANKDIRINDLVIDIIDVEGDIYTVTKIEEGAFSGCTGLTGNLTIENSVEYIGEYAFENCNAKINCPVGKKLSVDKNYNERYEGELKNGPAVNVYIN